MAELHGYRCDYPGCKETLLHDLTDPEERCFDGTGWADAGGAHYCFECSRVIASALKHRT